MGAAIDVDRFSAAERSALRLDGDCFDLGLTVVPVDVPVGAVVRASTLTPAVARYGLVADSWTAAWVHGASPALPNPLTLAVDVRDGRRTRAVVPPPREARFAPGEVVVLGGVRVTSPFKTAFDLLLRDPGAAADRAAHELLRLSGLDAEAAIAAAQGTARRNGKSRVVARIGALLGC